MLPIVPMKPQDNMRAVAPHINSTVLSKNVVARLRAAVVR
jgi:hypothetical protein